LGWSQSLIQQDCRVCILVSAHQLFLVKIDENQFTFL